MIVPYLIFSHLLADYVLQTNWLAARKGQFNLGDLRSWDGLLLHGFIVWLMSMLVLARYMDVLWPYITVMALLHTAQDALKGWVTPRLDVRPIVPYALDQMMHLLVIIFFQQAVRGLIVPPPPAFELRLVILGASLIGLTRMYEVSWWANWLDMIPYMNRWRQWGHLERTTMFLLSTVNLWWIAPLATLPRLYIAWQRGQPIWNQKRGMAELLLGIVFSVILGFAL